MSAINKEGQSQPVLTGDPILAENPYRPPGQPGEPSIVDFDNKSVTLRWAKPKDDGGRPISHYIIQKKDKFGKGASNKYARLDGGRGGQPKAYSVNKAM